MRGGGLTLQFSKAEREREIENEFGKDFYKVIKKFLYSLSELETRFSPSAERIGFFPKFRPSWGSCSRFDLRTRYSSESCSRSRSMSCPRLRPASRSISRSRSKSRSMPRSRFSPGSRSTSRGRRWAGGGDPVEGLAQELAAGVEDGSIAAHLKGEKRLRARSKTTRTRIEAAGKICGSSPSRIRGQCLANDLSLISFPESLATKITTHEPRLFLGNNGAIGLVSPEAETGDFIYQFWGTDVAVLLREEP